MSLLRGFWFCQVDLWIECLEKVHNLYLSKKGARIFKIKQNAALEKSEVLVSFIYYFEWTTVHFCQRGFSLHHYKRKRFQPVAMQDQDRSATGLGGTGLREDMETIQMIKIFERRQVIHMNLIEILTGQTSVS